MEDKETRQTRNLINVVKMMAHAWNGNQKDAKQCESAVMNKFDLPDWDELDPRYKISIYKQAWRELAEEGHEYTTDNLF